MFQYVYKSQIMHEYVFMLPHKFSTSRDEKSMPGFPNSSPKILIVYILVMID